MITLSDAIDLILDTPTLERQTEYVPLKKAINRVLAADIITDMDVPSFNKSAMDGYAMREQDFLLPLQVIETVAAGKKPEKVIGPGQSAKIMTGAIIPAGADMVVMKEVVSLVDEHTIVINAARSAKNILYQGEDQKEGDLVLNEGVKLNPAHLGILAMAGCTVVPVYRRPVVGLFSTGSELVDPSQVPVPPQIRNSNSVQIEAQLEQWGAQVINLGIIHDELDTIKGAIAQLLPLVDGIVFTGGASVGDLDFSSRALDSLGVEVKFNKVSIQPGKPALFGTLSSRWIFGLAGNPVSSLLQSELFIKPLLLGVYAGQKLPAPLQFPIGQTMTRKKAERDLFFPVKLVDNHVFPIEYHGSAHLMAYGEAFGLACFPLGQLQLNENTMIDVRQV